MQKKFTQPTISIEPDISGWDSLKISKNGKIFGRSGVCKSACHNPFLERIPNSQIWQGSEENSSVEERSKKSKKCLSAMSIKTFLIVRIVLQKQ